MNKGSKDMKIKETALELTVIPVPSSGQAQRVGVVGHILKVREPGGVDNGAALLRVEGVCIGAVFAAQLPVAALKKEGERW